MKQIVLTCAATLFALASSAQVTPQLWKEYTENPNAHPNIPNCSYAGYRYGDAPLPSGNSKLFNVKDYNAKGDGSTDDTEAIRSAVKAAEDAGGGVVYIPDGDYICSGVIFVNGDNVIIRGQSTNGTKLRFTKSLTDGYSPNYTMAGGGVDQIMWSWCGGMVWFTPKSKNTYLPSKPNNLNDVWLNGNQTYNADKEAWNVTDKLADITSNEERGDFSFTVSDGSKIKAGAYISIRYKNPSDWSLMKFFTGDGTFAANYTWGSGTGWINSTNRPFVDWVVQVDNVAGNKVTLKQPLRVPLRANWEPTVMGIGDLVQESGIENLNIELEKDYESQYDNSNWRNSNHNREKGWNGIYMNNAVNCFVRNVTVYDSEMGVGTAASKNITFTGIKVHGKDKKRSTHHGMTCRRQSQDILFENFELLNYNQFDHGINVEDFSMGNVWHSGIVIKGCFDTHKLVPAECLRTNIKVDVGGGYGGAGEAGPQIGTRFVHWNVELKGSTNNTITPATTMPMGAIVGVTGDRPSTSEASGCIVEASNLSVTPTDLYVGQKELRNGVVQPEAKLTPWPVWEVPSRIEAEDAKINFIGISSDSNDDGSNQYLNSFNSPENYAEYNINVPVSGRYKLEFRVCSEASDENYLSIRDKGVEIGHISFNGSGRGNWRTIETTVLLNPGLHTLQLYGVKGKTCLNYFKINNPEESSTTPFPQFETLPGQYNGFVAVSIIKPENTDVYYRIEGKTSSFTSYDKPIELTSTSTITTAARTNGVWSLYNSGTFEVLDPVEPPCRIIALDYTDQKGMSEMNIDGSNNQLSVGQAGDWASYYVYAPVAGEYQINSRISIKLRDGVTSTGFELYVNNEKVASFANLPDMGGNWDRFKIYPAKVYFKQGINEFKVVALNRRFNFDWFEVFKYDGCEAPGVIECENYNHESKGFGLHRKVNTSEGRDSGYEVAVTTSSKLYYPMALAHGGTYPISITLCSRSNNATGRLSVVENGKTLLDYSAPQVSGAQFESVLDFDVKLPKGYFTICFEQPSGGEHYLDKISIGEVKEIDDSEEYGPPTNGLGQLDNPLGNGIFFDGNYIKVKDTKTEAFRLVDASGNTVKTGICSFDKPVDVSMLAHGVYVFILGGDASLKFIKL